MADHTSRTRNNVPAAAFAMRRGLAEQLFSQREMMRLHAAVSIDASATITEFNTTPSTMLDQLEILITGWDSPRISAAELDRMPRLGAIVHAAGTVKGHLSKDVWTAGSSSPRRPPQTRTR